MKKTILASEVTPGMTLDASLDNTVFTVVTVEQRKATGTMYGTETVIRGPLGIVVKRDSSARVTILD